MLPDKKRVPIKCALMFSLAYLILLGASGMNQGSVLPNPSPALPVTHSTFNLADNYVSHVGDLVIEDVVYAIENTTFEQTGNIVVRGTGRLELRDSILILNQSQPYELLLQLQDYGALYVISSEIRSNHAATLQLGQASSLECHDSAFDRISIALHDDSEVSAESSCFYQVTASEAGTIGMVDCWLAYLETDGLATATVSLSFCGGVNIGGASSASFTDCTAGYLWCTESSATVLQLCDIPSIRTQDGAYLLGADLTASEIQISGDSSVSLSGVEAEDLTLSDTGDAILVQSSFNDLWISGWAEGSISGLSCEGIHLVEHAMFDCESTVASYLALEGVSNLNLSTSTVGVVDVWDWAEMTADLCVLDTLRARDDSVVHILEGTIGSLEMTERSSLWSETSSLGAILLLDTSTLHATGTTIADLQALDDATMFLDWSTILSAELDCAYCIISNSEVDYAITYSPIQATNSSLETMKVRSTESLFTGCTITSLSSEFGANVTAVSCVLYGGYSRQTSVLSLYDCELTWLLLAFEVGECHVFDSTITGVEAGGDSWILLDNTTVGWRGILLRENNTVALANRFTNDGAFTIWTTGRIIRYFLARAEFVNGTPLDGTPVQVFLGGSEILSGTTDSKGEFLFNMTYVSSNVSSIHQDHNLTLPDYPGVSLVFTYDQHELVLDVPEPLGFSSDEPAHLPGIGEHVESGWTIIIELLSSSLVGLNLWLHLMVPLAVLLAAGGLRRTHRKRQGDCQNEK
jgi:hypothetical protein